MVVLFPEARDRSDVVKTSREREEIKEESCKAQGRESVQGYLNANKDELSASAEIFREFTQFAFTKKQELASA